MSTKSEIQVSLDGALSIQNAQKIKGTLLHKVVSRENVLIVCQNPTHLDLSILQLLIAAQKKATAEGKKISLHFQLSPTLQSIIINSGFSTLLQESDQA